MAFIATMSDQPKSSAPGPSTGRPLLFDDANVHNLNASLLYINSLPVEQRYDRYLQILNDLLSSSKRNDAEIARARDRAQESQSRESSVYPEQPEAPQEDPSNAPQRAPDYEQKMASTQQAIIRVWGESNTAKLWCYAANLNIARGICRLANTGFSLETAVRALNRVVFERLTTKSHRGRQTKTPTAVDFYNAAKNPDREEVTAEGAREHRFVFGSNDIIIPAIFASSLPPPAGEEAQVLGSTEGSDVNDNTIEGEENDESAVNTPAPVEPTGPTSTTVDTPMSALESEIRATPDIPVGADENELPSSPTPVAGYKRDSCSAFGPESRANEYNKKITAHQVKQANIEDQQMPVVDSAIPSQNYQFVLETFQDQQDSSETHDTFISGFTSESANKDPDRENEVKSHQEDDENGADLNAQVDEVSHTVLSRTISQCVEWECPVVNGQLHLLFGNEGAMRHEFIRRWEDKAEEAAKSILRELFALRAD